MCCRYSEEKSGGACLGALIPEKILLISQTENNLLLIVNHMSIIRTVMFNRGGWKLCPVIKLIALKNENL